MDAAGRRPYPFLCMWIFESVSASRRSSTGCRRIAPFARRSGVRRRARRRTWPRGHAAGRGPSRVRRHGRPRGAPVDGGARRGAARGRLRRRRDLRDHRGVRGVGGSHTPRARSAPSRRTREDRIRQEAHQLPRQGPLRRGRHRHASRSRAHVRDIRVARLLGDPARAEPSELVPLSDVSTGVIRPRKETC